MPEQPAKSFLGFSWGSAPKPEERLATPEELAEYGALAPDPETEAKILALFEEQLLQDLIREMPGRNLGTVELSAEPAASPAVIPTAPAAANESAMEPSVMFSGSPETPKFEPSLENQMDQETLTEALEKPRSENAEEEVGELAAETATPAADEAILKEWTIEETVASARLKAEESVETSEIEAAETTATQIEERGAEAEPVLDAPKPRVTPLGLLEIGEAIDQHRLWVDTSGKEGARGHFAGANLAGLDLTGANLQGAELQKADLRGADLSMANLRNANLVEGDLRDTNLLGTELSGSNLMGANLYGAQGLWAGRLGGTNLFDATLPEAVATLNGRKTIEQFTQSARWSYLLLIGLCVVSCGLIALTTDVRLLLDESATVTARIPKILPLQGFYLGAPLLLTIFYLRLQFLLLRLWGSMGALPAVFPDGQTPEKDGRWYLMGPIRPYLRWTREPHSAVGMVECYVAIFLAYWAVPAALFFFWVRYLVMQDYRGTLLHVFLFTVASAGACGLPRVVKRVLRPGDWTEESTPQFIKDVWTAGRVAVLAGLALLLVSIGVIRGLPGDSTLRPEVGRGDPRRWAATAFEALGYHPYADLTEENVSARPTSGTKTATTGEGNGPRLNEINLRYSRGYHADFANARMWRANLEGSSLGGSDFHGANLREANLRSAKMDHVVASKANLVSADARGAVFNGGDFQGSDWSFANLQGATLTTANLTGASLYSVNLQQANLLRAELGRADLRDTHLERAVLSLANLEQTDFSAAKMADANLTGVEAKGTIFLEADLSNADLRGGTFAGAVLRQVKLGGAKVTGADFRGALGLEAWQVCATDGWRGAQFDADVLAAVESSCGAGTSGAQPQAGQPR